MMKDIKLKYDLNGNCIEESSDAGYMVKKEYDGNHNLKKELPVPRLSVGKTRS